MSEQREPTGETEASAAVVRFEAHDRGVNTSASGLLAALNTPDLLTAADLQVARRLGRLGGCEDESVLVAVALAVRAVRHGSVCLDLADLSARETDHDWPPLEQWRGALLASPLVREPAGVEVTPLVLDGALLYLDRYWQEEGQVVAEVRARQQTAPEVPQQLAALLDGYFPDDRYRDQRDAVEAACRNWLTVVTGGPGTGKTTTVARLLGVLLEGGDDLRIALAAPTGRAAARLAEAVGEAARHETFPEAHRAKIAALEARTLHRLLGWQPARRTFRHDRSNRLPYDVVVVDETSMVSLTMMARLLEAVRPQTRLVLVGDADQLASVDAGAVLGDLVEGLGGFDSAQVSQLGPSRRYGVRIGMLAEAIKAGRSAEVMALLTGTAEVEVPDGEPDDLLALSLVDDREIESVVLRHATTLQEKARSGDHEGALEALEAHRLLCAHREGLYGAGFWNRRVERALAGSGHVRLGEWYVGRPVIVTENDYGQGLYNGDVGVVVQADEAPDGGTSPPARLVALISEGAGADGRPGSRSHPVARLPEVRSAHAMTVHRSQGSQVEEVTVLLPETDSRLLTRQLLYTAVTRAKKRVRVVGSEAAVRAAVEQHVPRASGLAERLRAASG